MKRTLGACLLLSCLFSCKDNSTGPKPPPRPAGWGFMGLAGKHIERVRLFRDYLYACAHVDGLWRIKVDSEEGQWQFLGLVDSTLSISTSEGVSDVAVVGDTILVAYRTITSVGPSLFRASVDSFDWQPEADTLRGVLVLAPSPHFEGTVLLSSGPGAVYKSPNFGRMLSMIFQSYLANQFRALRFHPTRPNELWISGWSSDFSELLHSTDGGVTWQDRPDIIKTIMLYQLVHSHTINFT